MWKMKKYIISLSILLAALPATASVSGACHTDRYHSSGASSPIISAGSDWLVELSANIIAKNPDPTSWAWDWGEGVLMVGLWRTWERTGNQEIFNYCKAYIDHYIGSNGEITVHIDNSSYVNKITPAALLPPLYQATGDNKYLTAAQTVLSHIINDLPQVSNGAYCHTNGDELWVDTIYMACIFLIEYGKWIGGPGYYSEAADQVLKHAEVMFSESDSLFYHGWDEDGSAAWANPVTHQSPCFWARGNGWPVLIMADLCELMEDSDPLKVEIQTLFQKILHRLLTLQDSESGLWYTVVDRGNDPGNYLEVSGSAMFLYGIQKALLLNLLDMSQGSRADSGDQALDSYVLYQPWSQTVVVNGISGGTVVGDYSLYVSRPLGGNYTWGLGTFLLSKTLFRTGVFPPETIAPLSLLKNDSCLTIKWNQVRKDTRGYAVPIDRYRVYRKKITSTDGMTSDSVDVLSDTLLNDTNHCLYRPDINLFYSVKGIDTFGHESQPSEWFGEADYVLKTTFSTDFNFICAPLNVNAAAASKLIDLIPGCNSIACWSSQNQAFKQYIQSKSSTDFAINTGDALFVNIQADTSVTFLGKYEDRHYTLQHNASLSSWNSIMLPFEKTGLSKASDLMTDIPNCNGISQWDVQTQGYHQYDPLLPASNFAVSPGNAYLVHVSANTTWPGSASSAKVVNEIVIQDSLGTRAPHLIMGMIPAVLDREIPIHIEAFAIHAPKNQITEMSSGCGLDTETWHIQCASFGHSWAAGDTVIVRLLQKNQLAAQYKAVCSWKPSDLANLTYVLENQSPLPEKTALIQNYPNPFNPVTQIDFALHESSSVSLQIFNTQGRLVRTLTHEVLDPGTYSRKWTGVAETGQPVPSGIYVAQLKTGSEIRTIKMLLVR